MANPTPTVPVADPHAGAHAGHGGDGHHGPAMLVGYDGQLHPSNLQHHFISSEQQFESSKLGMWLFLATEILLFGGMFVAYGIYRVLYPELYEAASLQLDTVLGALNTLVLLTSSLTMAWAIRGAQMDNQKVLFRNLVATLLLATGFLVVKYFEYEHKFHLGIFPGANFELNEGIAPVSELGGATLTVPHVVIEPQHTPHTEGIPPAATPAAPPEAAEATPAADAAHATDAAHAEDGGHGREGPIFDNNRAGIFFAIYFVMTGIHALHILIGIIAIGILAWKARRGRYSSVWYTPVENVGLYWHVVDIIWIFVFPLMYLI
jgi:cytochrome c oxidase subunit 3